MDIFIIMLVYISSIIFLLGMGYQIYVTLSSPNPLVIPQGPQSSAMCGVIRRTLKDVLFFRSLFIGGDWPLWLAGLVFHWTFAVLIGFHVFGLLSYLAGHRAGIDDAAGGLATLNSIAVMTGRIFVLSLITLLFLRAVDKKSKFISSFIDYFLLILLALIGISGNLMRMEGFRPDLDAVKGFMISLMRFTPAPLPASIPFVIHLTCVMLLLLVFPFTKLFHAAGFIFSPTRLMPNNARIKRHVNPWDNEVAG